MRNSLLFYKALKKERIREVAIVQAGFETF
jgi:hypothetical protein